MLTMIVIESVKKEALRHFFRFLANKVKEDLHLTRLLREIFAFLFQRWRTCTQTEDALVRV